MGLRMRAIRLAVAFLVLLSSTATAGELTPDGAFAPTATTAILKVRDGATIREISSAEIETLPHYRLALPLNPLGRNGTFQGVRLTDLLRHLQLDTAPRVSFRAHDAYGVNIARGEAGMDKALFATRFDGAPIPLNEQGPFRLMWAHNVEDVIAGTAGSTKWIWNIAEIRSGK